MYYEELTKHLKVRKNLEFQETSNSTNIVDENFGKKSDVFFSVMVDENFVDSWILDSKCSFHILIRYVMLILFEWTMIQALKSLGLIL